MNKKDVLVKLGVDPDIAELLSTDTSSNITINLEGKKYTLEQLDKIINKKNTFNNTNSDNFDERLLYKVIFDTIDFNRNDIKDIIDKAIADSEYDIIEGIDKNFALHLLDIKGGHTAFKFMRYIEKDYDRAKPVITNIIKKTYPKINSYIKKNTVITDSFYTSFENTYNIRLDLPEKRNLVYLLACYLKGHYIPEKTSNRYKTRLEVFNYSTLCKPYAINTTEDVELKYTRLSDDLGFYNGDLPAHNKCEYTKPFRELKTSDVNTNCKDLRKAILDTFHIDQIDFRDPYNIVFTTFINNNGKLNYDNARDYTNSYPFTIYTDDIYTLFKHGETVLISDDLNNSYRDIIIDYTCRFICRGRLGVKKDYNKILDFICNTAFLIKEFSINNTIKLQNALHLAEDENYYHQKYKEAVKEVDVLKESISESENKIKTLQSKQKDVITQMQEQINSLKLANDKLQLKVNNLEEVIVDKDLENRELCNILNSMRSNKTENSFITVDEITDKLKAYKIALIGGLPDFVAKVNTDLPFIKTASIEESLRKTESLKNMDILIVNIDFTGHSDWWKMKKLYSGCNIIYINEINNIHRFLYEAYERIKLLTD